MQLSLFAEDTQQNIKKIVNNFGESLIKVEGNIPVNIPIKPKDRFLFISYDQSFLTHGLHKYPAKFFPELPRWLIQKYSQKYDLILDPFSGSGTTNLEALLLERHSVGIDIDPFSRFLSKVKVTPLNPEELLRAQKLILNSILNYNSNHVQSKYIPDFPYRDNWFNKEIILELAYLKQQIEQLDSNLEIKNFLKICLSSIIREVSNADNRCTRTVIRKKLNKQIKGGYALQKFTAKLTINVQNMIKFSEKYPSGINTIFPENMDARNLNFSDNYFDLAVTSPPYVNAVDYPRTHQLEIYWLELLSGSLTPLKKKSVGTESVSVKDYQQLHTIGIKEVDQVLETIFTKDKRRSYIAFKYLQDMQTNLQEVYRVLKPSGRYVVVVGNNTIRGEIFENWLYIMKLAERIGFKIETYFGSEIIRHFITVPREERINTDWVLVLQK
jgi:DNA modification methylase